MITFILRCEELKLIERCHPIKPRMGTLNEISLKHTQEQYDLLKATDKEIDENKLEELSSHYDAIYIHPVRKTITHFPFSWFLSIYLFVKQSTFELSKLAVGSTIELIDSILTNQVQNGFAVIRPPGHHAMKSEYNGYCFFNNVAIAAQHALDNHDVSINYISTDCSKLFQDILILLKLKVDRILIVDFDVHHGQGTQQMFYDDPRVLYFSIHRYEHGTFWPNLRESDFDYVGDGKGAGYNFNVPLNKTGMTNGDYLAIWQQILIPVAAEVI